MKPYRDAFGNHLPKRDVELAAQYVTMYRQYTVMALVRNFGWGMAKAQKIFNLLLDAGVLRQDHGEFSLILTDPDAAVNAALRQLNKGRSL